MKRLTAIIVSVMLFVVALLAAEHFLAHKVAGVYPPAFGHHLDLQKNQGLILQRVALDRGDSIPVYGSSELSGAEMPYHPAVFFASEDDGVQFNLIGRGYSQSLIHLLNFGALADTLSSKKVVFIISPQWFSRTGVTAEGFQSNFSEQQFTAFMYNDAVSPEIKKAAAARVRTLLGASSRNDIKCLTGLYTQDGWHARAAILALKPYFSLKSELMALKDDYRAYRLLTRERRPAPNHNRKHIPRRKYNWDEHEKAASNYGKERSTNNPFYVENGYYDTYLKDKAAGLKGYMKSESFLDSPEYQDFELLLKLCRDQGIKPLFVSVPVNGWWYDYGGFPKSDREKYYANIRQTVSAYGFTLADFSDHEYDKYFLRDTMHLGWKGWVDVNEAILGYCE